MSKIELPQNGSLWHQIRSEKFIIKREYFINSNLKEIPNSIINLIQDMIEFFPKDRKDLNHFINNYMDLKIRYDKLINNEYTRSFKTFLENKYCN